jgi:hypothetical protein
MLDRTSPGAAILVAYWSSERRAVRSQLQAYLAPLGLYDELPLDPAPLAFLTELAKCAARLFARQLSAEKIEHIVHEVAGWDSTPHTVLSVVHDPSIDSLFQYFQAIASRGSYWSDKFRKAARDGDSDAVIVLRILSALRALAFDRYPKVIIAALFENLYHRNVVTLDDTLEALEDDAWIRINGEYVDADEVQISPRVTGMERGHALLPELLPRLREVMEYFVEDGRGIPDDIREKRLFTIGLTYSWSEARDHRYAAKAHRKAVELYGDGANGGDSFGNLVIQLFEGGQYTEGFALMDQMISEYPAQWPDMHMVVDSYRQNGDEDRLAIDLLKYLATTKYLLTVLNYTLAPLFETLIDPKEQHGTYDSLPPWKDAVPLVWTIIERYPKEFGRLPAAMELTVRCLKHYKREHELSRLRSVIEPHATAEVRRILEFDAMQ